jgi:hypothetical protein
MSATKKVTYDDTRDCAIRIIGKLIDLDLLEDNDDHYFEIQDTIHDEYNELLGLDIDDQFEVEVKPILPNIDDLKIKLAEYTELCNTYERQGTENLDYEETETYGVYLGKKELLEEIMPKLEKIYSLL